MAYLISSFRPIGTLLLIAPTLVWGSSALSLQQVLEQGLHKSWSLQIAQAEERIAAAAHHWGNLGFLPTAQVALKHTHALFPKLGTPATIPVAQAACSLDGWQPLFTYQAQALNYKKQCVYTRYTRQQVLSEVALAFYNLAAAQQQVHYLEEELTLREAYYKQAKARYKAGRITRLEFLSEQVQKDNLKIKLFKKQESHHRAQRELGILLQAPHPDTLQVTEQAPPKPPVYHLEHLQHSIIHKSYPLQLKQFSYRAKQLGVKKAYTRFLPTLNGFASYDFNKPYAEHQWGDATHQLQYGITLSFNLFNAFFDRSTLQKAKWERRKALLAYQEAQTSIPQTLLSCWETYQRHQKTYDLLQLQQKLSKTQLALAQKQYHLGKITQLAFQKARLQAQEVQLNLIEHQYQTRIAEIELLTCAGILTLANLLA